MVTLAYFLTGRIPNKIPGNGILLWNEGLP